LSEVDGKGGITSFLLAAASFVVVVAGLRTASAVILPFLLSLLIAMASYPLLTFLTRHKVPTSLAVTLTLLTVLVAVSAIGVLLGSSVRDFTVQAPGYKEHLRQLADQSLGRLQAWGVTMPESWSPSSFAPGQALDLATTLLRGISAALSNLVLVLLTIGFLLAEAVGLPEKLAAAFGGRLDLGHLERCRLQVQDYLVIKLLMSLVTGSIIAIALALMGVDFPLLWGALAFLLNFIPTIGSIIAALPPLLLSLVQLGPWYALGVMILFLAVNMIIGNILEPALTGRRLGLSTLVVFISLLFWGWVWGPVGMVLSVPLTMIIKIILENTRDMRWLATLLDAHPRAAAARGAGARTPSG